MRTLHDLIDEARKLAPADRQRLLETLEESLIEDDGPKAATRDAGPYANMLRLAGTLHSDFEDVSSEKYEHLSRGILDRPEER